ncbi:MULTISPECIES: S9 family peptidase [Dyella]|uniref:S9 family peptidase n=2 Tax=Dyella TaxID=231454 RepID=A0A4R0YXZ7_9GAMM|nr:MULTISPECIES: alpha/beta fold hydrolase [Dyella]TBR40244.1 S9 family peptidase [Dyella terrae]TCI12174.1 S9 family peptidase [Dyella soli]
MPVLTTSLRAVALCALLLPFGTASATSPADRLQQVLRESREQPTAPLLPRADFQTRTGLRFVRLSPDGLHVSWIWVQPNGSSVWLMDVATGKPRQLLASTQASSLEWMADGKQLLLEQRGRVAVLPMDGGEARWVTSLDAVREQLLLGPDATFPNRFLVRERDPESKHFRLLRVTTDQHQEVLYDDVDAPADLAFDREGKLAFVSTADMQGRHVRRNTVTGWQRFFDCSALTRCAPIAVMADGRLLMRSGRESDLQQLVAIDPSTKRSTTLHKDPEGIADLADVTLDQRTAQPLFAAYDTDRHHTYAVRDDLRPAMQWLDRHFARSNLDVDRASNGVLLVIERSDRLQRDRYFVFDPSKQALTPIAEDQQTSARKLPETAMAYRIPVSWTASDGMRLYGFLSLPPGLDPAKVPLVLRPHGGPKAQTRPGYDMITQFLVNRGYAVFEPNYRTSVGYGRTYLFAAHGDWGHGRNYRDMLEGMDWLLAQGVGDRHRQAIVGHSYGGFATLLGLTYDSARFLAGVGMASPPDLAAAFRQIAANPTSPGAIPVGAELSELGSGVDNVAAMDRLSREAPARAIAQMNRPLVLIAGAKDDLVSVASVTDYAGQLAAAHKPVALLVDPDSGHQLEAPQARLATLYLLEAALARSLGGRVDDPVDAALASYLGKNLRLDTWDRPLGTPRVDLDHTRVPE